MAQRWPNLVYPEPTRGGGLSTADGSQTGADDRFAVYSAAGDYLGGPEFLATVPLTDVGRLCQLTSTEEYASFGRSHPAGAGPIRVLTVSGSLRTHSVSSAVLDAVTILAPPYVLLTRFERVGRLPHFDPDLEHGALPDEVRSWRHAIGAADAILIASPEYAHGVPGSLKNALDWLVGGPEFVGKPVAVINPLERSRFAQPQLLETLRTMSGRVVDAASVTLTVLPEPREAVALARHPIAAQSLLDALSALCDAVVNGVRAE